jgi:hypothetical protein
MLLLTYLQLTSAMYLTDTQTSTLVSCPLLLNIWAHNSTSTDLISTSLCAYLIEQAAGEGY